MKLFFRKKDGQSGVTAQREVWLVVGLGNPGDRYQNTKHNVGFDVLDLLSEKHSIKINKIKFKALYGEGEICGQKVVLLKPQTFMNLSGESLSAAKSWYKVPEERIIVIFDDIDISLGELRIKRNGSAGSHNGMKSVVYQLGTDQFPRVKIGIGPKPQGWDLANYVLSKFTANEQELIGKCQQAAVSAVEEILRSNLDTAMNQYNRKV